MAVKTRRIALWGGISLSILVIILLSVSLLYLYRMRSEINKMAPLDSTEVVSGVYVIKANSYVNFYLVKTGSNLIAFDSGEDQNTVKNEMARLNLDPLKVAAVFLTHTDQDHVGALGLFSNAKVYISNEEEQMINGKTAKTLVFKNSLPTHYNLLVDNQDIDVSGLRVHCILTPGHTPGSMCYIVDDRYLFSGDTLSLKNNKVALFNDFFNMDTTRQRNSITRISRLPDVRYIFTTHYGYSDNYRESFAHWDGN